MPGLSMEMRQKLQAVRPRTIGQAGRIDGLTPAALTLLAAHIRRGKSARIRPKNGVNPGASGANSAALVTRNSPWASNGATDLPEI